MTTLERAILTTLQKAEHKWNAGLKRCEAVLGSFIEIVAIFLEIVLRIAWGIFCALASVAFGLSLLALPILVCWYLLRILL